MPTRILMCVAILVVSAGAADTETREVTYTNANDCPKGGCPIFSVDNGFLFDLKTYVNGPAYGLTVFDPTGQLAYEVDIKAPDGTPGYFPRSAAIAADADGSVLVPISYGGYGGNGHVKGGGIVVLDRAGRQVGFVDTARFLPEAACFGPDRSIWMLGIQSTPIRDGDDKDHIERADYDVVRKYSADGKLIGSFLPRSLFPAGIPPGIGNDWMRASRDRIGLMISAGRNSNNPEWVELDLDGKLTGRWPLGPLYTSDADKSHQTYGLSGVSFTLDGRLFGQTYSCPVLHHCSYALAMFDRATSTWKAAEDGLMDRFHMLMGADGNELVLWDRSQVNARGVHLQWIQPR